MEPEPTVGSMAIDSAGVTVVTNLPRTGDALDMEHIQLWELIKK